MEGKTVLYVPSEGQKVDPEIASRDKELVQRLESKLYIQTLSHVHFPLYGVRNIIKLNPSMFQFVNRIYYYPQLL